MGRHRGTADRNPHPNTFSRAVRTPNRAIGPVSGFSGSSRNTARRVEAASGQAVAAGARSYRHVDSMLKYGLDRLPIDADDVPPRPRLVHANVRGPAYYQEGEPEC